MLAFHPEGRRLFGDDAMNLRTRFPERTLPFPSRFLGKTYSQDKVEAARANHAGYSVVADPARPGSLLLGQGARLGEADDSPAASGLVPEEAVCTAPLALQPSRREKFLDLTR